MCETEHEDMDTNERKRNGRNQAWAIDNHPKMLPC